MADPFLAEVRMWALNFAPRGWAMCNGQIMSIAQNTALFSLLGTTYGGNGVTNFALPDVRSRVPMAPGQGPGLSPRELGEMDGVESVTLTNAEMPAGQHAHSVGAQVLPTGQVATPGGNTFARPASGFLYASSATPKIVLMAPDTVVPIAGGKGLPHENRQPFLGLNFCIALNGIFPARN
jgi:microcystin-dependent protein